MSQREKIEKYLEKYAGDGYPMQYVTPRFQTGGFLSAKAVKHAIRSYAAGAAENEVLGLLDTTLTGNGKEGFLFTDTMAYYKDSGKQGEFVYKDIRSVEVEDEDEDPQTSLYIYTKDGEEYEWRSRMMNKVPMVHFFQEVIAYFQEQEKKKEEKIIKSEVSNDAEKQVSDLFARLTK